MGRTEGRRGEIRRKELEKKRGEAANPCVDNGANVVRWIGRRNYRAARWTAFVRQPLFVMVGVESRGREVATNGN